jgi:RimJ/RimL family protein N-acetyltransferase
LVLKLTPRSIHGQSKSLEQTEQITKRYLPTGDAGTYRIAYEVGRLLDSATGSEGGIESAGLVIVNEVDERSLPLPEDLTLPAAETSTLTVQVAYMFLPDAWGKGYATEAVKAVLDACKKGESFWAPYSKVYVRAIVNKGNPASRRIMDKVGMVERGVYEWRGDKIFLAGEWRTEDSLHIYGMYLKS